MRVRVRTKHARALGPKNLSSAGEAAERRAGEPGEDPFAPERRAELPVEADRGRVPVEYALLSVESAT